MTFREVATGLVAGILLFSASAAYGREVIRINPAPSRPAPDEDTRPLTPFERGELVGTGIMKLGACIGVVVWFIRSRRD